MNRDQGRLQLKVEAQITVALAGPIAQRRFLPRSVRGWHSEGDYQGAAELALRLQGSGELATAYLKWMQVSTTALVEANWPHIDTVARALLEGAEIEGSAIPQLLIATAVEARRPLSSARL